MSEWQTWQVVDSALPTGLFAHSWGLESASQHGEVPTLESLREFVDASVLQSGHAVLPFVNAAFRSPERLEALDVVAEAFLTNQVANRASRIQGRTLIATAGRVWPSAALARLKTRADATHAHVAPLSGATFHALALPLPTAQKIVLYGAARGVLSAAVRLGIVGSYEAQRMQHLCEPWLERVAERCAELSVSDLAQTAPVIDLLQSRHDRLYSRLFQS
jgi:urease accessory protein